MEKRIRGELRQKILIGSEVGSIFFVFPVTWREMKRRETMSSI
jgi:hypothetical protein